MSSKLLYISGREGGRGEGGRERGRRKRKRDGGRKIGKRKMKIGRRNEGGSGGGSGREREEGRKRGGREGRKEKKERERGISHVQCAHEYTMVPFREISGGLVKVFADGDCGSSLRVTQLDILKKSVGHKLCV